MPKFLVAWLVSAVAVTAIIIPTSVGANPLRDGEVLRVNVVEAVGGKTVVGNLAVARATKGGFVTAYGCDNGLPRDPSGAPSKSDLNYNGVSGVASNRLIVAADRDGDICFFVSSRAELIVDISGTSDAITTLDNQRTDTRDTTGISGRCGFTIHKTYGKDKSAGVEYLTDLVQFGPGAAPVAFQRIQAVPGRGTSAMNFPEVAFKVAGNTLAPYDYAILDNCRLIAIGSTIRSQSGVSGAIEHGVYEISLDDSSFGEWRRIGAPWPAPPDNRLDVARILQVNGDNLTVYRELFNSGWDTKILTIETRSGATSVLSDDESNRYPTPIVLAADGSGFYAGDECEFYFDFGDGGEGCRVSYRNFASGQRTVLVPLASVSSLSPDGKTLMIETSKGWETYRISDRRRTLIDADRQKCAQFLANGAIALINPDGTWEVDRNGTRQKLTAGAPPGLEHFESEAWHAGCNNGGFADLF